MVNLKQMKQSLIVLNTTNQLQLGWSWVPIEYSFYDLAQSFNSIQQRLAQLLNRLVLVHVKLFVKNSEEIRKDRLYKIILMF